MESPQALPVCEFPLLRRRFLAAAGWLEDAPRPRPTVPLMSLARPQTALAKQAGAVVDVAPQAPSHKRALAGPGAISLNLSSLAKENAPSELQQRRQKFAYFEKRCSPVAPGVFLGSDAVARNRELLRAHGVTHVLNCAAHVCGNYFPTELIYRSLWLMDAPGEELAPVLYSNLDFVESALAVGGRVLVHCSQGVSRSSSCVIAYLMFKFQEGYDEVYRRVKAVHGIANPNMGFACQLIQWHKRRAQQQPAQPPRLYRLAPHSKADPRSLVGKHVGGAEPVRAAMLDPRGAFVLHSPTHNFVWLGRLAPKTLSEAAHQLADQLVRYERAAPPQVALEGEEPPAFLRQVAGYASGVPLAPNASYDDEFHLLAIAAAPSFRCPEPGSALAQARPGSAPAMRADATGRMVACPAPPSSESGLGCGWEKARRAGMDADSKPEAEPPETEFPSPPRICEPQKQRIQLYQYPEMEQVPLFDGDDLTSDCAFVLMVKSVDGGGSDEGASVKLYVWLGADFQGDGTSVAREFVEEMQLMSDRITNTEVLIEGRETAEFWSWFENG